jgi:hypothetical protein
MRRAQMRVSCCVLRKRLRNEAMCAAGLYRQPFHVQLMRMLGFTTALIRCASHSSAARRGPCRELVSAVKPGVAQLRAAFDEPALV